MLLGKIRPWAARTTGCVLGVLLLFVVTSAWADLEKDWTERLTTSLTGQHFGLALGMAYVLGLLTSLTPCVYPLIPITISLFGGRDRDISRLRALGLAACYVGGMCVMYTGLGLFFGFTGKRFGTFLANAYVMIPIILFFLLMAVSLFGAFSLTLPEGLQNALTQIGGKGALGALLMGLVAGLIAAPCTGPPLGALLVFVAERRSAVLGGSLLFVYALGIGTLFFLLVGFSLRLPKSGAWMESVKSIMGVVVVIAALFYMRNLVAAVREYGQPSWVFLGVHLGLIGMGIVFGGIHLQFLRERFHWLRKGLGLLLIIAGCFGVLSWVLTPKIRETNPQQMFVPLQWFHDEQAQTEAQKQNKPLLVEFSASWCLPCQQMKTQTFSEPQVLTLLKNFVLWEVDCSKEEDAQCNWMAAKYNPAGKLPTLVLIDRHGRRIHTLHDFVSAKELAPLLQQVQEIP